MSLPLTELEAINEILAVGSNSPVSSLAENQVIDASLARNTLRSALSEILSKGWAFNTEEDLELVPDQDGYIRLPRNTLRVRSSGASAGTKLTSRGTRLYSRTDRTDKFTAPVTVEIVLGLDFEDLPATARVYATIKAARRYQDRFFGDDAVHSYTLQDENIALAAMMDEELDNQGANMLNDSQSVRDLAVRA